jgi:hypothetical protein
VKYFDGNDIKKLARFIGEDKELGDSSVKLSGIS